MNITRNRVAAREALRSRPRPRIRPRGVMEYWSVGVVRQFGIAPRVRGVGRPPKEFLALLFVANQGVFQVAGFILCVESAPMFMKRTPIIIAVLALASGVYA